MTIAVYVADKKDIETMVPWGTRLAKSCRTSLLVVVPKRSKGKEGWNELTSENLSSESRLHSAILEAFEGLDPEQFIVTEANDEDEGEPSGKIRVSARELISTNPNAALIEQVDTLNISLLLIDADDPILASPEGRKESLDLFFDSACQTMVVRGKPPEDDEPLKVLVATQKDGRESDVAIKRAFDLVNSNNGRVTFLYVRPDDDEVAEQVGLVNANRLINRLYQVRHNIECRVTLSDKLLTGVIAQKDLDRFHLVIVTAKNSASGYKFVRSWEKDERTARVPLGVIKGAVPLTTRWWSKVTRRVRSVVPQMDRELRVGVVDRLHSNSKWDFDFIALISLSTLIAALGLTRNSGAVVIGAMLVAPLMTPLMGIGFALVQENMRLIRESLRSLFFGFALAFVIGMLVGGLVHAFGFSELEDIHALPSEMLSRGEPNFLDLVVALVSGVAGAYALGRPNLVSALPGVAIAAALVPPIATSGMALALLELHLFTGSLLLFLTNIVAIVLGCSIVFWAVGIDSRLVQKSKSGDDREGGRWPRYLFLVFVVLTILLAAVMHFWE